MKTTAISYDTEKYQIQKLPHPLLLHWILNPGLAINEVILGQRIPQVMLIDKLSNEPLFHRQYVPCPHCSSIHKGMLWGGSNSFGHWFGLICPTCKGKIPCLWNVTSLLLLGILFPIWMPLKAAFEERYIAYEVKRVSQAAINPEVKLDKFRWWKLGFAFGFFMFLVFLFQKPLTLKSLVLAAISGLIGGTFFGGSMWFFLGRKRS